MTDWPRDDVGRAATLRLSEAILILRGWVEERALLRCELRFATLAAAFTARAVEASDARLRLMGDDAASELVLPFRADFTFGFTDMRDGPPEHLVKYDGLVTIFFPYLGDPSDADIVVLCRLK